jgi:hypothetical protein
MNNREFIHSYYALKELMWYVPTIILVIASIFVDVRNTSADQCGLTYEKFIKPKNIFWL